MSEISVRPDDIWLTQVVLSMFSLMFVNGDYLGLEPEWSPTLINLWKTSLPACNWWHISLEYFWKQSKSLKHFKNQASFKKPNFATGINTYCHICFSCLVSKKITQDILKRFIYLVFIILLNLQSVGSWILCHNTIKMQAIILCFLVPK